MSSKYKNENVHASIIGLAKQIWGYQTLLLKELKFKIFLGSFL
jgi:hypothetical protein